MPITSSSEHKKSKSGRDRVLNLSLDRLYQKVLHGTLWRSYEQQEKKHLIKGKRDEDVPSFCLSAWLDELQELDDIYSRNQAWFGQTGCEGFPKSKDLFSQLSQNLTQHPGMVRSIITQVRI